MTLSLASKCFERHVDILLSLAAPSSTSELCRVIILGNAALLEDGDRMRSYSNFVAESPRHPLFDYAQQIVEPCDLLALPFTSGKSTLSVHNQMINM